MILPLSLKILIAVGFLLIVLFIILKSRRKYIWPLIIIVIGLGAWQGLKEYNRTNKDPDNTPAEFKVVANDLLKDFETGDLASLNKKYNDQIIEVTGLVKEIKKDSSNFSIMLGDTTSSSTVQCEMKLEYLQHAAELNKGSSVTVKGHFSGYQKGEEMMGISFGSTLHLNRCIIVADKNK